MKGKVIKDLHFQPWIGNDYENFDSRRLLLLGESHYIEEEGSKEFSTTLVIENFLANEKMKTPFYKRIELLFNEEPPNKIWSKIVFANLIQYSFKNSKTQPEQKDIKTIKPAFITLLDNLKPTKVIVLSKRMWNFWLPERNCRHIKDISINNKKVDVWEYNYDEGSCHAIGIKHPSRMFGEQYKDWRPIIESFLAL